MEKIKCVISENGTIIPIHNIAKISNVNRVWSNADAEDNLGHKLSDEQYNALLKELEIIGGKPLEYAIETKLKIEKGKWYVCVSQFSNCIKGRVYKATSDSRIIDDFGTEYDMHSDAYKYFRLWTIKDAKDGDILAVESRNDYPSPFIAIYKEHGLNFFNSHCFISCDGKFHKGTTGHSIYLICPATKEQRAKLEKAMTDDGYTFDFEKKELKKIEQKPTDEVKPKFKYGDRVRNKKSGLEQTLGCCIEDVYEGSFPFRIKEQDDWELVEQKSVKVEPKFHKGEWVVVDDGRTGRIIECTKDFADVDLGCSCLSTRINDIHSWTIQDAKDGDVIGCNKNGWTCIFKTLNNDGTFCSYCFINANGIFYESGSKCHRLTKECIKVLHYKYCPATKEQRDTLMKAMADAGYTFDFEKKELKILT